MGTESDPILNLDDALAQMEAGASPDAVVSDNLLDKAKTRVNHALRDYAREFGLSKPSDLTTRHGAGSRSNPSVIVDGRPRRFTDFLADEYISLQSRYGESGRVLRRGYLPTEHERLQYLLHFAGIFTDQSVDDSHSSAA